MIKAQVPAGKSTHVIPSTSRAMAQLTAPPLITTTLSFFEDIQWDDLTEIEFDNGEDIEWYDTLQSKTNIHRVK